jgi:uncharacterized protein
VSTTLPDGLSHEERLASRQRPAGSPIGYHRWHDLLFIHWRMPPSMLRPIVPAGLDIDTWDGDAWLGVVAFDMTGVRPWWSPAMPGVSAFHETNLRTYVHRAGRGPGVYFISLEAANSLAVRVARWRWNLPYYRARMTIARREERVHYASERLWPQPRGARTDLEVELGEPLGEIPVGQAFLPARHSSQTGMSAPHGHAVPRTLEFFLAERYLLYTASRRGQILCGQVHHTPYPLRAARLLRCEETLSQAAGICFSTDEPHPPCHAMFSSGVEVEIFSLRPS